MTVDPPLGTSGVISDLNEPHEHSIVVNADATNNQLHMPVLVEKCLELLAPALSEGGVVIDCTLGLGGHSEAILEAFPNVRVVGIDRDPEALRLATVRLTRFGERFTPIQTTYDDVDRVAARYGKLGLGAFADDSECPEHLVHGITQRARVDAILMDLGVSSMQLDSSERGFSYSHDAPLDMRMDQSVGLSAAELLAQESESSIARILSTYGEEKFARRIAHAIVEERVKAPLTTTAQLVELVRESIPAAARRTGGNPSKRTFQALRIAVNNELGILERAIPRAMESVRIGGRLVVESYQSLEDKIVKREFKHAIESSSPQGLPIELETHKPYFRDLVHGAYLANDTETEHNPRAASVRLRAIERLRETPSHHFNVENYRGEYL